MKLLKSLTLVGIGLILVGCGQNADSSADNAGLQIMTSFYPMQVFTQEVVGDIADVDVMITSNQDSHSYEPSARDIATLEETDIFIYNSNEMETWVSNTINSLNTDHLTVVETAANVDLLSGDVAEINSHSDEDDHEGETEAEHAEHAEEDHEGHNHEFDPHTWLDPIIASQQVQVIADNLKEVDPENAERYQSNADNFIQELNVLDEEFQASFSNAANRTFLTQHAAFAYLAERYNLEQVAVTGVSSSEEPSPQRLAELTDYIQATNAEVMYMQIGTSSNISETISAETGIEVSTLNSLETADESLPPAGEGYLQAMRQNLENLSLAIK